MAILHIFTIVFLFIIRTRFPRTKSLIDVIRFRYGNNVVKFIRKFEKLDYRLRKINVDIDFLNSCLENDLCPTFLGFKMSSNRLQNSESYQRSTSLFLHEELTFKSIEREKIIREMQKITSDLRMVISFIDWIHVSNKFMESNKKAIKHVQEVQNLNYLVANYNMIPKKSFIIFHLMIYRKQKCLCY